MASYRFTTTPASLPSPSTPDYYVDQLNQKTRFDSASPVDAHPQSFFDLSTSRQTSMPKVLFKIPGMGVYRTLSGMLGFRESQSLALAFICGGALVGFCLFHAQMLSQSGMERLTTPGGFYTLGKNMFHTTYSIHIILSVVGGILVIPQFIPAVRRRMMNVHRLNGKHL
ncbi:hypothetical protein CYLTODRAFT_355026 [Cylindrobasidium torrendii FP15055 ss-10]|uniref:Uncharacterized protein n=1 Tax=Cylindrobasidium torrendii FP15055 ss-10 TaxID=1314674 RepID=A0A0D7B839_9AGAR|nr:hypothetical protein CYLTODRAFT_355026 [Cylindrobasidium torrendii FP15055 ss-10]